MAIQKTTTTPARRRNQGTTPASQSFWSRLRSGEVWRNVKAYFKTDYARFCIGICTLAVSIYMLLCFVSNLFTGPADQGGVQSCNLEHAANYGGVLGAYVSYYFMDGCFGITSIFIPLFTLLVGVKLMGAYRVRLWKWFLNFSILMIWGSLLFSLITSSLPDEIVENFSFRLGGSHGEELNSYLSTTLGTTGAWMLVFFTAILYFLYITGETINVVRRLMHPQDFIKRSPKQKVDDTDTTPTPMADDDEALSDDSDVEPAEVETMPVYEEAPSAQPLVLSYDDTFSTDKSSAAQEANSGKNEKACSLEFNDLETATAADNRAGALNHSSSASRHNRLLNSEQTEISIEATVDNPVAGTKTVEEVRNMEPYDPRKSLEYYKYPVLSLLKHYDDNGPAIDMAEQNANKDRIINVLRNFGVEISSIKATIGPTITLYEVTPAPGVRINRIRNLEDDIALSLSALGIRIIAPIPGKGTIGIEVPNKNPCIVSMESIINTKKFQESTFELPIALGKTITNEVFMVDLAKMPHLLVAGATGQGKSVGLNAIITSLLYKKHPSELKFVMVDPKKVEFSIYTSIEKHFLAKIPDDNADPIITDVTKVVQTLKSLCQLMDHRYDLLKKAKVRNIKEYNAKFKSRQLNPENGHEFMPYIVVIIDEFGDLIMTAGKEVELPIARIAQLARAVGMHMVIATQRPTTNIITGTIKANFPARMAFKVMSQIDSRTILDQSGANQLVGKGDMLFLAANTPVRVQCAFVDTPEVEKINDFISKQQGFISAFELPEPEMDGEGGGGAADLDTNQLDPLFDEAARLIVIHQQGSTSLIQRKFSIGFNRAGRLMDQLERAGIVGPTRGSKPREVLIADEIELDSRLEALHR